MIHKLISGLYYRSKPCWRAYRTISDTQYLTIDELEDLQLQKLRRIAHYAQECIPFWRHRFEQHISFPEGLDSLDDMQQLPILEKDELRSNNFSKGINIQKLVNRRSGGSTGEPVTTYASTSQIHASMAAMLRFYNWIDYQPGEPRAKLFAAPTRLGVPEHTLQNQARNWMSNTCYLNALDLTPEKCDSIVQELQAFQPKMLLGYTSALFTVAKHQLKQGRDLGLSDLRIVNAAEPLDPYKRQIIQSGLGGQIYNHYGTREVGDIADECEARSGLHVHMEHLIVEIVDDNGKWVEEGQEGEILITELENYGLPLFRYRIGDRAVRSKQQCECGRGLQLIPSVVGRNTDNILLPNGNKLTGLIFPHILKDFPIVEYQIIQKSLTLVEVQVVVDSKVNNQTMQAMHNAIQRLLPEVDVSLISVKKIPRSRSGKLRSVVSEIDQPEDDATLAHA